MDEKLKALSHPISDDAIRRTSGAETKKGYDTTGYAYQYLVDRFNEVLGIEWGFSWSIIDKAEGTYRNDVKFWEVTVSLGIWVLDQKNERRGVGGHRSSSYSDALKGAITNGFKKTSSFWGVGAEAFRGTIDDNDKTIDDDDKPEPGNRNDVVKIEQEIPSDLVKYFKESRMSVRQVKDILSENNYDYNKIRTLIKEATK